MPEAVQEATRRLHSRIDTERIYIAEHIPVHACSHALRTGQNVRMNQTTLPDAHDGAGRH